MHTYTTSARGVSAFVGNVAHARMHARTHTHSALSRPLYWSSKNSYGSQHVHIKTPLRDQSHPPTQEPHTQQTPLPKFTHFGPAYLACSKAWGVAETKGNEEWGGMKPVIKGGGHIIGHEMHSVRTRPLRKDSDSRLCVLIIECHVLLNTHTHTHTQHAHVHLCVQVDVEFDGFSSLPTTKKQAPCTGTGTTQEGENNIPIPKCVLMLA